MTNVDLKRLDSIIKQKIDYMKIDVIGGPRLLRLIGGPSTLPCQ
ncbi:MAG: hypothetical protein WCC17_16255 [Candidatus Nitrosopolaris sp.]